MSEVRTGFSIFGLLFNSAYYAGKGKVGKAMLLATLTLVPLIGTLGVPVYCGIKANEEVGASPFSWGRAVGFSLAFAFVASAVIRGLKIALQ